MYCMRLYWSVVCINKKIIQTANGLWLEINVPFVTSNYIGNPVSNCDISVPD